MMRFGIVLSIAVVAAGCGADDAPFRPTSSANVSIGTNGVSAGTNLGVSNGILSIGLGQTLLRR